MPRPLGQILQQDFGWEEIVVETAITNQEQDGAKRRPLGSYLRDRAVASRHDPAHVGMALVIQRSEAPGEGPSDGARFDLAEYVELSAKARDDRHHINEHIRSYVLLIIGLLLFIGYPLNTILLRDQTLPENNMSALTCYYSLIGLGLFLLAGVVGDNLVKSYGAFLKRCVRVDRARIAIRDTAVRRYSATRTAMPWRLPKTITRPDWIAERPDPELGSVQRNLPIYYSAWAVLKVALATYFIACLLGGTMTPKPSVFLDATSIGILLFLPYSYFLASMCERYHKHIREALAITPDNLFPRVSSVHLRNNSPMTVFRNITTSLYVGTAILAVAVAVTRLFPKSMVPREDFRPLIVMGLLVAAHFCVRVIESLHREKHMTTNQA